MLSAEVEEKAVLHDFALQKIIILMLDYNVIIKGLLQWEKESGKIRKTDRLTFAQLGCSYPLSSGFFQWFSKRQNSAVTPSCALVHLSSCPLKVILLGWSSGMVFGFLPQRWIPVEGKVKSKNQESFNDNRIGYINKQRISEGS